MKTQKHYSVLDKLAGRKVLYHGTSDEGAESIKNNGLKHSFYDHPSNNTLNKLNKHKNGTLNPILEKLMDFDEDKYKNLIYTTSDKHSADFMAEVNKRKGRGGQTLKISIPYKVHRKMNPISNPEYQQAAHIHDKDKMSRHIAGKPFRELSKKEKKNIKSFLKAKHGDWILKDEDIPSKYIKGSKDYTPVTLKEIWDYRTGKYDQKEYSWNDWIDRRIQNSEKRRDKIRQENKAYRATPLSPEDKRLSEELRKQITNSGVTIYDTTTDAKGGGFCPDPKYVPEEKWEKFGVDKEKAIKKGGPMMTLHPETKPHIIAHEFGHSQDDFIKRHTDRQFKKKGKLGNLSLLLEETRANIRGYKNLKKLKPNPTSLKEARKGFINTEKMYLEHVYQNLLKKLKR